MVFFLSGICFGERGYSEQVKPRVCWSPEEHAMVVMLFVTELPTWNPNVGSKCVSDLLSSTYADQPDLIRLLYRGVTGRAPGVTKFQNGWTCVFRWLVLT